MDTDGNGYISREDRNLSFGDPKTIGFRMVDSAIPRNTQTDIIWIIRSSGPGLCPRIVDFHMVQ